MHPFQNLLSREKGFIRRRIEEEREQEWKTSKKGGHLRQTDATLPVGFYSITFAVNKPAMGIKESKLSNTKLGRIVRSGLWYAWLNQGHL
jgi:hypothetical protein